MTPFLWALVGAIVLLAAGVLGELWLRGGTRRPLSHMQPTDIRDPARTQAPLGMEATDRKGFHKAVQASDRLGAQPASETSHLSGRDRTPPRA